MPSSASAAAPEPQPTSFSFSVHAEAEPGVLSRLLELFTKRGLVPAMMHSALSRDARELAIEIEMPGLERDAVDFVAACMRQIIGVRVVLTSAKTAASVS